MRFLSSCMAHGKSSASVINLISRELLELSAASLELLYSGDCLHMLFLINSRAESSQEDSTNIKIQWSSEGNNNVEVSVLKLLRSKQTKEVPHRYEYQG